MAQHAGAAGAGRGRQVPRLPEDREKAEEREHQRLLGFAVEEQALERHHGSRGPPGSEELDQSRIAGAAARDHQLVGGPRGRPALDPAGDGLHGQRRRRRDGIVVGAPRLLHLVEQTRRVVGAEALAPRALGWRSEEHTSELQSPCNLVCRLLLEKKKQNMSERYEWCKCGWS